MIRAGTPTTIPYGGTSLVTIAPAPIIAPSPIDIPSLITTFAPTQTSLPIIVFLLPLNSKGVEKVLNLSFFQIGKNSLITS